MMLIILDRDGVINEDSEYYIKSPDEWHPIPGSLEAIAKLKKAGHQLVIVTNQSGIARGLYSPEILNDIHQKMFQQLAEVGGSIDAIFYCPHHPDEHCECRKPKPGLLLQVAEKFQVDIKKCIYIGDSLRDIEAAKAAQCLPILVLTGNGQATANEYQLEDILIFKNLAAVADAILSNDIPSQP